MDNLPDLVIKNYEEFVKCNTFLKLQFYLPVKGQNDKNMLFINTFCSLAYNLFEEMACEM